VLTDKEFDSFLKALGLHIRCLRKQKNVNMRDIMIETGFYDSQWRKYEAGGGLNLKSLMKIAQALKVTLVELLDGLGQWPQFTVAEIQAKHHIKPQSDPGSEQVAEQESNIKPRRGKVSIAAALSKQAKKKSVKRASKSIVDATGSLPVSAASKAAK
jgi:transcriptional regulator with XRE-family HTH domain